MTFSLSTSFSKVQTHVATSPAKTIIDIVDIAKSEIEQGVDANFWAFVVEYARAGFEDRFIAPLAVPAVVAPVAIAAPAVERTPAKQGYYTIRDGEGHVTLRVLPKKGAKVDGTMSVAYLFGPDNTSDYVRFGYLVAGTRLSLFEEFKSGYARQVAAVEALFNMDKESAIAAGKLYAEESGRCRRCGRVITRPDSLDRSMGAECAGME